MKGTWQGSGTWQTTSGPSGCAVAVLAAAVVAVAAAEWLAARIWWVVGGTVAVAVVVAVAFVLLRWAGQRDARHAPEWKVRAEVPTRAAAELPHREVPALGPAAVHFHFHGVPGAEQAEVIRRAIGGE